MEQDEPTGCLGECSYFQSVKGTCTHDQRQVLRDYLGSNPATPCPVLEDDAS